MGSSKRVQLLMEPDLVKRLDAKAKLEGTNRTELVIRACELFLSESGAVDGADALLKMLNDTMKAYIDPQINRMAKMISKDTKASATAMYLIYSQLVAEGKYDAIGIFKEATSKAASYLTTKES